MVATIIISMALGLYLAGFAFFEIRRRMKGKRSFFAEEDCACKSLTSRRLLNAYRKAKKAEMRKEAK